MSVTHEEFIGEVLQIYDTYTPSEASLQRISSIDLTSVSAPGGMGKDTLIAATHLPKAVADTIRTERVNDGILEQNGHEYWFRAAELDVILDDLRNRDYIQIGKGPSGKSFYGTRASIYPAEGPVLVDIMTSQVDAVRSLPFRSVEPVFVTVQSMNVWKKRLFARGPLTQEQWKVRQNEGRISLKSGLDDERYTFMLNDDAVTAAKALHRYATTRQHDKQKQIAARKAAYEIYKDLAA